MKYQYVLSKQTSSYLFDYRTEFFCWKFLPMEIFLSQNLSVFTDIYKPSAIRSVFANGIHLSVYTDRIADGRYSFFGKLQQCDDVDFFR